MHRCDVLVSICVANEAQCHILSLSGSGDGHLFNTEDPRQNENLVPDKVGFTWKWRFYSCQEPHLSSSRWTQLSLPSGVSMYIFL